jgi:hypothetical protein
MREIYKKLTRLMGDNTGMAPRNYPQGHVGSDLNLM